MCFKYITIKQLKTTLGHHIYIQNSSNILMGEKGDFLKNVFQGTVKSC
jgi:hypothetical protein